MSLHGISELDIRKLTGVSERSLKRLQSTYWRKNPASAHPLPPGRPWVLTPTQVKVCHMFLKDIIFSYIFSSFFVIDCVEHQPNSSLVELQTELHEVCMVKTLLQTITRSLQQEGYTMKMVCRQFFFPSSTLTFFQLGTACFHRWEPLQPAYLAVAVSLVKVWRTCQSVRIFLLQFKVFNPPCDISWWHHSSWGPRQGDLWQRLPEVRSGSTPTHERMAAAQVCPHCWQDSIHKVAGIHTMVKNVAHAWSIFLRILPTSTQLS